jgi:ketosteroid isomerase-like protein
MDAVELAQAYFDAVRSRDAGALRALFADDGVVVSGGVTHVGPAAIAEWYETQAFLIEPEPMLGPFIVDGDRVAVEIDLQTSIGRMLVCDVIETRAGRIERVAIYGTPRLEA